MSPLPSLSQYLSDPCGTLSLPYYKAKDLTPPPELRIVHHRSFRPEDWPGWLDAPYFRLFHPLRQLPRPVLPPAYRLSAAAPSDCASLAALLGLCYGGVFQESEVHSWRKRAVFRPELWLLARTEEGALAGAVLGEYDAASGEGTLEWLQVHPDHRRRGLGMALTAALLARLAGAADFATVSGACSNPTAPEALYRRCGFTGCDVWHILRRP